MMKISKNKIFPVYIYVFGSTVMSVVVLLNNESCFVMCYFMIFLLYILFLMKNMETHLVGSSIGDSDMCLADSASTHTILKDKKFFSFLIMQGSDVNTISGSEKLIEGSGRANILLPGGTKNSY